MTLRTQDPQTDELSPQWQAVQTISAIEVLLKGIPVLPPEDQQIIDSLLVAFDSAGNALEERAMHLQDLEDGVPARPLQHTSSRIR